MVAAGRPGQGLSRFGERLGDVQNEEADTG